MWPLGCLTAGFEPTFPKFLSAVIGSITELDGGGKTRKKTGGLVMESSGYAGGGSLWRWRWESELGFHSRKRRTWRC